MAWVKDRFGKWRWVGTGPPVGSPPQTPPPPTPTTPTTPPPTSGGGGGGGGFGGADAGFELPDWLKEWFKQSGQYNIPLSTEMLLWGQVGEPSAAGQRAQELFTPERYMQEFGIEMEEHLSYGKYPTGRYLYGGSVWPQGMTPRDIIAYSSGYRDWKKQMTERLGVGAGARQSGFLPDKGAYMAELQGTLTEYAAQLGVNREAFEANLAGRGISGAGQATETRYRDVTAPVMRAGGQAVRQSFLDYLQAYQRGSIAAEGFRQQSISRLTGTELAVGQMEQTTRAQNLNRLLQAHLGEGQLDLGFKGLDLQASIARREFSFRAYENKLKKWMFEEEMRQRERERESNWWSDFFGNLFEAGGTYAAAKGL